jgi:hypothetical protein
MNCTLQSPLIDYSYYKKNMVLAATTYKYVRLLRSFQACTGMVPLRLLFEMSLQNAAKL